MRWSTSSCLQNAFIFKGMLRSILRAALVIYLINCRGTLRDFPSRIPPRFRGFSSFNKRHTYRFEVWYFLSWVCVVIRCNAHNSVSWRNQSEQITGRGRGAAGIAINSDFIDWLSRLYQWQCYRIKNCDLWRLNRYLSQFWVRLNRDQFLSIRSRLNRHLSRFIFRKYRDQLSGDISAILPR